MELHRQSTKMGVLGVTLTDRVRFTASHGKRRQS